MRTAFKLLVWTCSMIIFGPSASIATEGSIYWRVGDIFIEQAWARVVSGGLRSGAMYMTVHNISAAADILLSVESPVAKAVKLHESKRTGDVVSMQPLPSGVPLPSQGEVEMRPGKIHIMLAGVSELVKAGGSLPVRLIFRDAGVLEISVPVIPLQLGDPEPVHITHANQAE